MASEKIEIIEGEPWTEREARRVLTNAAERLGMNEDEVVHAYRRGELPDTPAAFDAGTAIYASERLGSNGGGGHGAGTSSR